MSERARRTPPGARYRRAEGLELTVRPCDWPRNVTVRPRNGMHAETLDGDALRLLTRLGRWHRADELGCDDALLARWELSDLLFWSSANPTRALGGEPIGAGSHDGPIALARNAYVRPLVARGDALDWFDFMPRRGELAGAELVGIDVAACALGHEILRARVVCCPRHGAALRWLVPRLDGRHTRAELERDLPDVAVALEALDALGLLERRAAPALTAPPAGRARVTWLGHAAVLVEAAGRRLLVDPIIFPASVPQRPGDVPPDWRDLGPVDAILITHGDNDHLNPSTLTLFPRETPIFIPEAPIRRAHQVDMEALLAILGYGDVRALPDWGEARLGDLTLTAVPFLGEDWGLPLAKCTWLVDAPEATLYFSADSAFMPEVYPRIRATHTVDLALLGVTGSEEAHVAPPGFGYGDFYEGWIPDEKRNEWIVHTAGPAESAEAARLLGARRAFGYAAGGTSFHEVSYSDRGTHADLAALLAGGPCEPVTLGLNVPYLIDRN